MTAAPLFLSPDEITTALEAGLAELGAIGGAIGGGIGAGAAGAVGGGSGGRAGARFGTRRFTKLDSRARHWPQPPAPELDQRLRAFLGQSAERALTAPDGSPVVGLAGIVGSGSMNLNPCVIETIWDASGLRVVAHAREGLIKQRTCEKALDRLQAAVFGAG